MLNITTMDTPNIATLDWLNDTTLIDWGNALTTYDITKPFDKPIPTGRYHLGFGDAVVSSPCKQYALLYNRLSTKALLLKDHEVIREYDRSYYHADAYEYPCVFFEYQGETFLAHCPKAYNRLEFENIKTGEIITNIENRNPSDFFHSRLEISPDGRYLISKGWVWHPCDLVSFFDIKQCFNDPTQLDKGELLANFIEINSASFINAHQLLFCTTNELLDDEQQYININSLGIYDLNTKTILSQTQPNAEFGNVFAIDDTYCWDTYLLPKVINIKTGETVAQADNINSGKQRSSIIWHITTPPPIAFNPTTKKLAIFDQAKIHILTFTP